MPYTMKTVYLLGLLWLYLLGFVCVVVCVEPGYLDFDNLPDTNFSCVGKVIGGYYADLETNCQMFHVCTIGQLDEPMDIRFLCLNGTVFDQETRVCERIDEVDCSKSERFYSLNLELYGNTQPSISEDNADNDPPIIIKASTTTTTTTTTTPRPKPKTTKAPFFTTAAPTVTTVTRVISAHHFPISNGPDIRFNPEEINISLNPGTAANIRSKTVAYQQQVFNDNKKKVVVTTHTSYGAPEKEEFVRVLPNTQRPVSSTQKIKGQPPATPSDINYGFTYHQTENSNQDYTEPPHNYQYHHSNVPYRHGQFRNQFKTTTYRSEHLATTRKHPYNPNQEPTTFRTPYVSSLKTPTYHTYRTEKPQRLQLPLPLLPTLPPLTFSSPAPFSLGHHHIETKRYTSDQPQPRIIISASASVSDNRGRRLNYSLGTIGVTPLLEEPPKSYDEYKDHDVVLDPFYHDVPKIKTNRRKKRQVKPSDVNSEQAAVDVLKFLFEWYNTQQKSSTVKVPIDPEDITEINEQLAPIVEAPILEQKESEDGSLSFKESALFKRKSKFNIVGDVLSVTEAPVASTPTPTPVTTSKSDTADYVDDNYEALVPQPNNTEITEETKEKITTTEKIVTTTVAETTLPPTTTTTEPTTTSRIMGLMRKRAKTHHKRILNENRRRYIASLNALKPKIRRKDKQKTNIALHNNEETTTSAVPVVIKSQTLSTIHTTSTQATVTTRSTTVATTTEEVKITEAPEVLNEEEENQDRETMTTEVPEENKTEPVNDIGGPQHEESRMVQVSEEPTYLRASPYQDQDSEEDQIKQETKVNGNVEHTTTEFEELISQNENNTLKGDSHDEQAFEEPSDIQNEELETETVEATTFYGDSQNEVQVETTTPKEETKVKDVTNEKFASKSKIRGRGRGRGRSRFNANSEDIQQTTVSENDKSATETTEESAYRDEATMENLDTTTIEEIVESQEKNNDTDNEETVLSKPEDVEYYDEYETDSESLGINENTNLKPSYNEDDEQSEISPKDKILAESSENPIDENSPDNEVLESTTTEFTDNEDKFKDSENKETALIKPSDVESDNEFANQKEEPQFVQIDKEVEIKKLRERARSGSRTKFHNNYDSDKERSRSSVKDETSEEETEPKNENEATEEVVDERTMHDFTEDYKEFENEKTFSTKPESSDSNSSILEAAPTTTESTLQNTNDNMEPTDKLEDVDEYSLTTTPYSTTLEDVPFTSPSTTTTQYYEQSTMANVNNEVYQTTATESSSTSSTEAATNLTPAAITTTELPSTTSTRYSPRRTRPPRTRTSSSYRRPNSRHRFSTELTSRPSRRKPAIEEEIIDVLTSQLTTTESLTKEEISTSPRITTTIVDYTDDVPATDAPLFKSANPTQAESAKESLHTTPLSMVYKLHVRKEKLKSYIFNCFGKAINRFYSDPRDCRLFHYCTSGYTKNQLLDMKFVCDLGTYFDEEKLICTKNKPERCL